MKKSIMKSHEIFCAELIEIVKTYEKDYLEKFIETYKNTNKYLEYVEIYKNELKTR